MQQPYASGLASQQDLSAIAANYFPDGVAPTYPCMSEIVGSSIGQIMGGHLVSNLGLQDLPAGELQNLQTLQAEFWLSVNFASLCLVWNWTDGHHSRHHSNQSVASADSSHLLLHA
jgi:hypothetical protein